MGRTYPTDDELNREARTGDRDPPTRRAKRGRVWSVGGLSTLAFGAIGARTPNAPDVLGMLTAWIPGPFQAELGAAACEIGIGVLVMFGLWAISLLLAYLGVIDLAGWFAKKDSKSTRGQQEGSAHLKSAGMKWFGAVVIGGSPTLLSAMGFSLLDCVDPIEIFTAVIIPIPL